MRVNRICCGDLNLSLNTIVRTTLFTLMLHDDLIISCNFSLKIIASDSHYNV